MKKCLKVLNLLIEKKVAEAEGDRLKIQKYQGMIKCHVGKCPDCQAFLEGMREKTRQEEAGRVKVKVGRRMRELRRSLSLTQEQFANRIPGRVDHSYIGKIERGHQYPSIKLLEKIGKAYGVLLGYFFQSERWLEEFEMVCVKATSVAVLIKKLQEGLKKLKAGLPESR